MIDMIRSLFSRYKVREETADDLMNRLQIARYKRDYGKILELQARTKIARTEELRREYDRA